MLVVELEEIIQEEAIHSRRNLMFCHFAGELNINVNFRIHRYKSIVNFSVGQETVQDILSRFQDIFGILKNHQPPNGLQGSGPMSSDKRQKMQDQFRTIRLLFKRLRLLYEKCDNADDYTQVESLIPFVDDDKPDTVPVHSEEHQRAIVENRELNEALAQKNLQLKEIIDSMRNIIWEINSMMAARKS